MYRKNLLNVLICGSLMCSLAACGTTETTSSNDTTTEIATEAVSDSAGENTITISDSEFTDDTFTGKVDSVDGDSITLSVTTMDGKAVDTSNMMGGDKPDGAGGDVPDKPDGESDENAPEKPEGETAEAAQDNSDGENQGESNEDVPDKPDGEAGGEAPEKPDGDTSGATGEAPEKPNGDTSDKPDGEAPDNMETSTVTVVLTIGDESVLFNSDSESATLSDIEVGDYLTVELDENSEIKTITIKESSGEMAGGMGGSGGPGSSTGVDSYDAVQEYTEDNETTDETYTSTGTDENAIHVYNGATVTLNNATVTRDSDDSTGGDNSSFYGVGAALLVSDGTTYVNGGTFTTDAAGGAGIFSYGTGITYVSDAVIKTNQDTSGGIHVAGGGTLYAWDLDVETNGESSAAIRSDRGSGTMVVDGGTYVSNGTGSPAIYCTADITVNNATLTANNSEAICIEGLNTIRLYDCDLSGAIQENSQNDCNWNVIVYQSMSGDSEVGNGTFSMSGGSITAKNGGMFYTTNTECTFYLSDVDITYADQNDFFLRCTGNANARGWGSTGSNGSDCTFTADNQSMEGDVIYDSISNLDFYMKNGSTLKGAFVDDESCAGNGGDGYCNVYISEDSIWTVTGDSIIKNLYSEGTIVDDSGNTVTIKGNDGTVYVEGNSQYTITVDSYETSVDLSDSADGGSFSDCIVSK
jgi:hypothetical protein